MAKKKRKSTLAPEAALTAKQQNTQTLFLVLAAAACFFAVCLTADSSAKGLVIGMALLVLVLMCLMFGKLRDRMSLPMFLLAALVAFQGVAALYAKSRPAALTEYLKILSPFLLVLLLMILAPSRGMRPERWIGTALAGGCAVGSLVSIDLLSTHLISGLVLRIVGLFSSDYAYRTGLEAGVRMNSMYGDGNVFAGMAGLGVLLGLGLACSAESKRERAVQLVMLYVNALAFLLAFSMGATAAIAVAFLAVLALERKDRRMGLLALMLEALVLCVLAAAVISMTSFQPWDGFQPIPLLCAVLGAAGLWLLDGRVGQPLAAKLADKSKLIPIVIGAVVAVLAALLLAAYNITGGASLSAGEGLRRAAYPDPGTYTLDVEADGPVTVTVESQDKQQTMMHTSTVLYTGDADGAAFTVPEGSLVVYFNFYAPEGARLDAARYAGDGGEGGIPLGYKLLPGFIANRLQGLWANENAIQRLVFFSDGMKMFAKSPIFGLGLGAFGSNILNVQTFYYRANDVHNCYIQYLLETGIIGLALFLALMGVCAASVWFERKKGGEAHPLTPALGAALVFMAIHGAAEIAFFEFTFLAMAFGCFALTGLCCAGALPRPQMGKKAKTWAQGAMTVLIAAYTVLLLCGVYARSLVNASPTYERTKLAVGLDKFTWGDHIITYINANMSRASDPETRAHADELAGLLAEKDPTYAPYYLATYYFLTDQTGLAFDMVDASLDSITSSQEVWQTLFDLIESFETDSEEYRAGVLRIAQRLEDWNDRNIGQVTLSEETQAFIARLQS